MTPDGRAARGLSLLLVALTTLIIARNPAALGEGATIPDRIALALALLGVIGGTVHGIGHAAQNWLLRRLAVPWVAWALLAAGGLWLAFGVICCAFVI